MIPSQVCSEDDVVDVDNEVKEVMDLDWIN
jgi:hypothetical protein